MIIKRKKLKRTLLFLLFISLPADAELMLLIHGYLGDATSWEKSGINEQLHQQRWQRAGMFRGNPHGPQLYTTEETHAENQDMLQHYHPMHQRSFRLTY